MSDKPQSTTTNAPRCELCGGKIYRSNKYGVCKRNELCLSELDRRRYQANREKVTGQGRRYYQTNREKRNAYNRQYNRDNRDTIAAQKRRHREANREACVARERRYYQANREECAARKRRHYQANRETIAANARRHWEANRETIAANRRRYYQANRETIRANARRHCEANREKIAAKGRRYYKAVRERIAHRTALSRALRGSIPASKQRGHLAPGWLGGGIMYCSIPGCHRCVGWRCPSQIKRNKTGLRCPDHRNVQLPRSRSKTMNTNPPNRFDPLWHDALGFHAGMVRHANGARTALRLLYRDAYRFAAKIIEIQQHFHNEFVAHASSTKMDVDAWMDEHFEPIEKFGGDRRRLMRDIQDGMTEKEYVEHSNTSGPQHRAKKRDEAAKADTTAPVVSDDMSDAEKVTKLTAQLGAVISENKQLRRDNAVVLRENEQLRNDFARLERIVEGRKKKLA